ncbi:glycogen debranching protein GlgX [Georgenia wangjunii]|uniref:glycogen debranching protein GlgX n=1 Tax=Georgenia wangjunii TaxID=3117730 RepID=UPI002F2656D5
MQKWPGRPYPLGATFDGTGTNFALFSSVAEKVELCLLDDDGTETRVNLTEVDGHVWHAFIPGVQPGLRYGYRVHGPFDPAQGLRCDPSKLLLDPYAKAIDGQIDGHPSLYSYQFEDPSQRNEEDSAPHTMTSVVINPFFDWGHDRPPDREYHDSVIYEAHVKGLTQLHPDVPDEFRGTYAGIADPAIIEHLTQLGVTAIELMPVHQFVNDPHLQEKGLSNYWGYNTIGFFAPHNGYTAYGTRGQQVQEFKQMVKALHEANIEVILDVVYNHTAEGNHMGPTLSFRGIDNASYYRLVEDDQAHYFDTTGTGNSLLMRSPHTLQMIMDSLRYWVEEMHVDGFRFDLASTLARELHEVDRLSAFFDIIQQDPVISQVKLIAEPWDLGEGGYQVGGFPPLWTEWNGNYRDTVRDYWRGEPSTLAEFASRITGSSDLYEHSGRRPVASINFVTAHDGFTLRDLVSYNEKHNEANGENNNDGESHNRSWNCGVEGPTDDPEIRALRTRQQRNFLATLLFSQGVPMIAHGDELGRTQQGNNNVYCQDDELAWVDWDLDDERAELLEFTRTMVRLRAEHPVFRRRRFFAGTSHHGGESEVGEIAWFAPGGEHMRDEEWNSSFARSVMVFLNGKAIPEPDVRGNSILDDSFLVLLNADKEPIEFTLPGEHYAPSWRAVLDTDHTTAPGDEYAPGATVTVTGRSVVFLLSPLEDDQ